MCGRYARRSTKKVLADWFGVDENSLPEFGPSFNIAPQTFQPIVRLSPETGEREIIMMRWGLVPSWAKDARGGAKRINARAEGIAATPGFRAAIKTRRCLVPADAFYEWQKLGAKSRQPFAIAMHDETPYAFAGLWESWREPSGQVLETFTIITTDANELLAPMHDRMPVILEPKDYDRWLQAGEAHELPVDLLRSFPAERMKLWKASSRVGNVRNDTEDLLHCDDDDAPSLWQ